MNPTIKCTNKSQRNDCRDLKWDRDPPHRWLWAWGPPWGGASIHQDGAAQPRDLGAGLLCRERRAFKQVYSAHLGNTPHGRTSRPGLAPTS